MDEMIEGLGYPIVEVPPPACASREAAVACLVRHLVEAGHVRAEEAPVLVAKVLRREALSATLLGNGLALPHVATESVNRVTGVVGRAASGIPWAAPGDIPVRHICLLLTPASKPLETLLAEEAIVRHLFKSERSRDQAVRLRAFRYWESAGRPAGNADHFWYQAERDLRANHQTTA